MSDITAMPADGGERGQSWPFITILWMSATIGLAAHLSDRGWHGSVVIAAGLIGALVLWVHRVFRVHAWTTADHAGPRPVPMLLGSYVVLVGLLVLDASHLVVLFGIFSLTFTTLEGRRRPLLLTAIVTVVWMWAWWFHDLPLGAIATPVFVWGTLNVINHFLAQVTEQSEERRRLLDEISRTQGQLAEEERRRGVLEERDRMAAEIHDTVAQGFTSIVLLSEATAARMDDLDDATIARTLGLIEQTARENLTASRRLVAAQGPAELDQGSLPDAIETLAERHRSRSALTIDVSSTAGADRLNSETEILLLRVAQEALANTVKHADARKVTIQLTSDDTAASITIADDGIGFDAADGPGEVAGIVGGHGLRLLRDRIDAADGSLSVQSSRDGTVVTARVPKNATEADPETEARP